MFSVPLRADEIQIGSGTGKQYYLPSYSYYHFSLTQQLYTAEELGGIAGTINSIAFYNDGTTQTRNFDIYMVNTNKTSYSSRTDWVPVTASDKVFSGNVTMTKGTWTTIVFTTPFDYDGTNIAIMVDDNTDSASSSGSHAQYLTFNVSSYQSIYAYSDGTNYDPSNPPTTGSTYGFTFQQYKNQIKLDIVTAPVTCAKPSSLETTGITAYTASLDWTKGSEDQDTWEIYLTENANDIPNDESEATISENVTKPYNLSGLTPSTNYYAYVRANCGGTDGKSKWSAVWHFATTCVAIETFPFTETFDDLSTNGEIPMCWNNEEGTTTNENHRWCYNSSYGTGHSGKCVRFDSYSNPNDNTNFLKTPVMHLSQGPAMQLRFWYKNPKGGDFSVFISTDGGQTHETALATGMTNIADWTEKTIDLSDYKGENNVVIVFKGTSNYGSNDARIYLDDVNIELAPTCPKQNGLHVIGLTSSSATLDWTAGNSEQDHWDLFITTDASITPDANTTPTVTNTDQKPYTFTRLNDETVYFAFVRARCSDTDLSDWTDACRFVTPQIPVVIDGERPYHNDFETTCGWLFVNGDRTNQWHYGSAANNTENGEKAIYISNDGGTSNTYTSTKGVVYATKAFSFAEGVYTFTYDWRAKGNQYYDYIRVALVPASVEIVASENLPTGMSDSGLPTGWIALDGGSKLNNSDAWNTKIADEIQVAAGEYKMVVVWRNLTYTVSQPPAAIDNISISLLTCPRPTNLISSNVEARTAILIWRENGTATNWTLQYATDANFTTNLVEISDNDSFVTNENLVGCGLIGLSGETTYYARVKSDCESLWSDVCTFTTLATCVAPSSLSATKTATTITLSWTAGAEGQDVWDIRYKANTDSEYTYKHLENQTTTSYTITGLSPATTYSVNVRAYCSEEDQSKWGYSSYNQNSDLSVTTDCGTLTLPYTCDFEGALETSQSSSYPMPKCWTRKEYRGGYEGSYTYYPSVRSASYSYPYAHGGNGESATSGKSMHFYKPYTSSDEAAILPEVDGQYQMKDLQISFWARLESYQTNKDLTIGVMTDPSNISTFTEVATVTVKDQNFQEYTAFFNSYTGNGRYIAIRFNSSTSGYIFVDDVTVDVASGCRIPQELEATVDSDSQATLTWTAGDNETAWNVQYKKAADSEWSELIAVNEPTYTFTGLQRATIYDARVQANCDAENQSDWAEISFTTDCGIWPIDAENSLFEDFENVGASDFPPICWTKFWHEMSGNTNVYWYLSSNNNLGSSAAYSYWNEGYAFLVMPKMHIDGNAALSFDYLIGSGNYDESCSVVVSNNGMTYNDFTQTIWAAENSNSGNASATVSLSGFNGQDIYVAFKFKGSGTSGCTWYVDNVHVYVTKKEFITEGNWNVAENWQPAGVPTIEDDVIISANVTIPTGVVAQANSISINGDSNPRIIIEDGGQLVHNSDNTSSGLEVTMKKNITGYGTGNGNWYLIVSPMASVTNPSAVANMFSNSYDLYRFNPSNEDNEWENYIGGNFNLVNGQGNLYANSENVTLSFIGNPNTANEPIEVPLTYDADDHKCWNLVGNPFTCEATLDREYYVLNSDSKTINPTPIEGTTPIPPCAAVFVKATETGDKAVFRKVE